MSCQRRSKYSALEPGAGGGWRRGGSEGEGHDRHGGRLRIKQRS